MQQTTTAPSETQPIDEITATIRGLDDDALSRFLGIRQLLGSE